MELNGAIKSGMDLRRYELATLAAAQRRSSYTAALPTAPSCASGSESRSGRFWPTAAAPGSTRSTSR